MRCQNQWKRKGKRQRTENNACWRRVVAGRFHFGGASRPQLRWSTTASWVRDSVIAARSTLLSKTTRALNMLKGTDGQHAGAIAFQKRVFGSRSTAGRVATPQDLSVTKQHRNDRWDRCTASAGDWQIITTTSHRSANQRYFMHNSATEHRMRVQFSELDSSRYQLCNDTSTGVVRHQITKWRRLQKVVSYDVLHHRGDPPFMKTDPYWNGPKSFHWSAIGHCWADVSRQKVLHIRTKGI